jgi:hypothetical protein
MAIDISIRNRADLRNEDQRWIGNGGEPIAPCRPIVLDRSAFDLVTDFPNGYIPSGVALAKLSASGLYVPYAGSPSEVQTLTRTSTAGTVTLTCEGETTGTVPASAAGFTAAAVQAALLSLSNLGIGDVTVTGSAGGPLTVTFGGARLGVDVGAITVDNTSATGGTVTVAQTTAGGGAGSGGSEAMAGHLFVSAAYDRDSTADIGAALFWHGEVITNYLPTGHGLDAAGRADVAGWITYTTNVV